jgi:serine/threonine protein kinase
MTLESGARIGQYEIRGPLGAGGMGVVYRAFDTRLTRDVAIKLLSGAPTADGRLLHEARAIAALNHRHICTVYEVGAADGVSFIAMELVDGRSLRDLVATGRWPAERVCRIGRELAEALEHAHAHNIIHRDFKTANVMMTADGHAKVVDFGIAVRTAGFADSTQTLEVSVADGRVSGTVPYMAPEVLQGAMPSARSDLGIGHGALRADLRAVAVQWKERVRGDCRDSAGPSPAAAPGHARGTRTDHRALPGEGTGRPPGARR